MGPGLWLALFGERWCDPLDIQEHDIVFLDISRTLSKICRFGGRCSDFYSVAQHSVLVARLVERVESDPVVLMAALLHDAAEAYLGDIVTPLKRRLTIGGMPLRALEEEILVRIFRAFSIPELTDQQQELIKGADLTAFTTEARDLMGEPTWAAYPSPWHETVKPLGPDAAEREFTAYWRRLHQ